jgi:hypothetical protein
MIKGLIGSIGRFSRDAAILLAGFYVLVWAVKELNPQSLISEAESRQIAYVDKRMIEKEKLDEFRYHEQMKAVSRIDGSLMELSRKIDQVIKRELATLPIDVNNNKN